MSGSRRLGHPTYDAVGVNRRVAAPSRAPAGRPVALSRHWSGRGARRTGPADGRGSGGPCTGIPRPGIPSAVGDPGGVASSDHRGPCPCSAPEGACVLSRRWSA